MLRQLGGQYVCSVKLIMVIAPLEPCTETETPLGVVRSLLLAAGQDRAEHYFLLSRSDVVQKLTEIEELSKVVDHLQILAARAAEAFHGAGIATEHNGGRAYPS